MEQEEDIIPAGRVLRIQCVDPLPGKLQQISVLGQRFLGSVAEIGQQAEVQVDVAIGEEPHFQRLHKTLDVVRAGEHGRDHHQGARFRRDARGEIHARQRMRRRQQGGQPVHQRHRELAGGQQREDAERRQCPIVQVVRLRFHQQACADECRDQCDRAQVQQQGRSACRAPQRSPRGKARLRGVFKVGQAPVDQVETHVRRSVAVSVADRACTRKRDGAAGDRVLGNPARFRHMLDDMAVAVAAGEIHRRVGRRRILAQGMFDHAHGLDELAPVHRAEKAQAANAVADGDLVGGLLLGSRTHQLLDIQTGLGQLLFDPGQGQGQGGALPLQAARQFRDERRGHRRDRARHVRDHQDQVFRILACDLRQFVRPGDGQIPVNPAGGDAHRDAAQIFDQRQSQHDGDGPQLTKPEGGDGLVGRDETTEAVRGHASVAMGDGLDGEVIHARQPCRSAIGQARQFPAVTFRQVAPGRLDLLFDEIEVVEQPFPGGRDAVVRCDGCRQPAAGLDQHALVRGQPRQQLIRHASLDQAVGGRQPHAVLFHLIRAEQLRPQRRLFLDRFSRLPRWSQDDLPASRRMNAMDATRHDATVAMTTTRFGMQGALGPDARIISGTAAK